MPFGNGRLAKVRFTELAQQIDVNTHCPSPCSDLWAQVLRAIESSDPRISINLGTPAI
jgi:hypothetical protein